MRRSKEDPMAKTKKKSAGSGAGWSLVLSYISSLLLTVLAALLLLYSTLCSASYMQGQVRKTGFGQTAYQAMCEDFTSYAAATGFSAETLTGVISQDQIETDLNADIDRLYDDVYARDTHLEIAEAAYSAMEAEAQAKGVTLEGQVKEGVEVIAEAMRQEYVGYTNTPLASQLHTFILKVEKIMWVGVAICAVFTALALILMMRMSKNNARLGARCLVFSFGAAAVVCLVLGLAIYPLLNLQNLNLNPLAFKNLVLGYVQGMFSRFNIFAVLYFIIALLLGELLGFHKRRQKDKLYVMDADNNPINPAE